MPEKKVQFYTTFPYKKAQSYVAAGGKVNESQISSPLLFNRSGEEHIQIKPIIERNTPNETG